MPIRQLVLMRHLQSGSAEVKSSISSQEPQPGTTQPSSVPTHIWPPSGLQQIAPTPDPAAAQQLPDMSQTASAAGCPAPLPSELHPAPSFSADSLQLPGFAQAVTVTPEAQLSPELSQASSDSLETQIACLQVGAEANVVAQACVRSPELPIQAKSAFAQAAAATVWYEPPALTTAHAVTSLDPTVTTSNQPGPNMPAVTALASQPGSHQGMNPQQGWGHESVDPTLQAQSGSDGSRLAHHEDSSCQSHEPWQNVHGNAWAVDQSGGFSTAAQTDQTMLSTRLWRGYSTYPQSQQQHGSEDDAHELVHDYYPHPAHSHRSAHYQQQLDHGFKAPQQPGRADYKAEGEGHHGGTPAAIRKAGGSRGAVSRLGTSVPQIDRQSASFAANSTGQGKVLTAHRHKASCSMHGLPCTGAVTRPGNKQSIRLSQQQITADADWASRGRAHHHHQQQQPQSPVNPLTFLF
ncbi:hypothetical protein WJX77_000170 [Trebouxia sp. C0004]